MALKDRQPLFATESRSYQKNRALLMVQARKTVPAIPAFPVNVLSAPALGAVPQVPSQKSALPADPGLAIIDKAGHPDNLVADMLRLTESVEVKLIHQMLEFTTTQATPSKEMELKCLERFETILTGKRNPKRFKDTHKKFQLALGHVAQPLL